MGTPRPATQLPRESNRQRTRAQRLRLPYRYGRPSVPPLLPGLGMIQHVERIFRQLNPDTLRLNTATICDGHLVLIAGDQPDCDVSLTMARHTRDRVLNHLALRNARLDAFQSLSIAT